MSNSLAFKLDRIVSRAEELRALLGSELGGEEFVKASRELSDLEPIVEQIDKLRATEQAITEAEAMLADPDMAALAEEEPAR